MLILKAVSPPLVVAAAAKQDPSLFLLPLAEQVKLDKDVDAVVANDFRGANAVDVVDAAAAAINQEEKFDILMLVVLVMVEPCKKRLL